MKLKLDDTEAGHFDGVQSAELSAGRNGTRLDERTVLAQAISKIAIEKGTLRFEKNRRIADLVETELKLHGEFFRTYSGALHFLSYSDRRLLELGSREFAFLLMEVTGLGRMEAHFRFALEKLEALARRRVPREVHTLSYYDPSTGMLAVSNGGEGMWIRRRGGRWHRALNGDNGIIFRTDCDAEPWEPEFRPNSDSRQHLNWYMQQFPFASLNDVHPEAFRHLLQMCLFHRFFPPLAPTKLIPTFLGPPGSGKSTAQRLIGRLLVGPRYQLSDLNAESHDGFVAAITNRTIHGIDNVDANVKWLRDDLARYATGISFTKRRPYSLNEPVSQSPTALLTLSSCRPDSFKRADIAQRVLPLRLKQPESFLPEAAIFSELSQRRSAIMGDVLEMLGEIENGLADTSHIAGTVRMADFASFATRAAVAIPSAEISSSSLRHLQVHFSTDCDDLIEILRLLLQRAWPAGIPPTFVSDLYLQCAQIARKVHLRIPDTLQGFGQRLSNEKPDIEARLDVKLTDVRGHANRRKVELQPNMEGSIWKKPLWIGSEGVKRVKQVIPD